MANDDDEDTMGAALIPPPPLPLPPPPNPITPEPGAPIGVLKFCADRKLRRWQARGLVARLGTEKEYTVGELEQALADFCKEAI